ncbi:MAG: heavy metal-responsive transcriptional regulator [Chloroflexi bacterium]|nr:heavy metal-responsive transcriptional regulator [Chloroflexota bacterium]
MLNIGEVARRAGVNVQTLRYYERRGLLREPQRRPSGYRSYPPDAVRLVRFVKRAQELGFTLAEIEELITLREDRESSCAEVRAAAVAKVNDIDRKLKALRAMKRALGVLVASCAEDGAARSCPILEAIESGPPEKAVGDRAGAKKEVAQ